jgi:hypothetical protein
MTKKSHASPRYNGCKRHTPEETEMTQQTPAIPPIVDRATWQAQIDALRVREKAHTREGDAIAAARRRLPMVEIDGQTPVHGPNGLMPFIDVFAGRSILFASYTCGMPANRLPINARAVRSLPTKSTI